MKNAVLVEHPLVQAKLALLRARSTDPQHFREALRAISAMIGLRALEDLELEDISVETPLEICAGKRAARPIVVIPILRAGLGMAEGILSIVPNAIFGHIGMYRDEQSLLPHSYYFKAPRCLNEAEILLVDPMLATGNSAVEAVSQLKSHGAGARIRLVCIVGCQSGLERFQGAHPDVAVYLGALDRELNDQGYILPGLGDAGDRYFGTL